MNMDDSKTISPLIGLFLLFEVITAGYIAVFWYQFFHQEARPWEHREFGAIITVLFIASNALLPRFRRWGVVGLIVCGGFLALALLPTL